MCLRTLSCGYKAGNAKSVSCLFFSSTCLTEKQRTAVCCTCLKVNTCIQKRLFSAYFRGDVYACVSVCVCVERETKRKRVSLWEILSARGKGCVFVYTCLNMCSCSHIVKDLRAKVGTGCNICQGIINITGKISSFVLRERTAARQVFCLSCCRYPVCLIVIIMHENISIVYKSTQACKPLYHL